MQAVGEEKSKKLNNKALGADGEAKGGEESAQGLREKFASDLEKARERAEVRLAEMNYAASYRSKLKREMSAAALRKKALREEEARALENQLREKREENLRAEIDEIEKRRLQSRELLLNLKKKETDASLTSETEDNESLEENKENESESDSVLKNSGENESETTKKSKVLFAKKARFKLKKPDGIKIKVTPLMPHVLNACPYFASAPLESAAACVFGEPNDEPCVPENTGEALIFPEAEASASDIAPVSEELNNGAALAASASFAGTAYLGARLARRAARYPRIHETALDVSSFSETALENLSLEEDYSAPLEYERFSDVENFDADFENYTDVEHTSPDYATYTDVEHTAPDYATYTDVEHTAPDYARYTDVEHTAPDYTTYTDVDYASPEFDTYSDVTDGSFNAYHDHGDRYTLHSESYEDEKAIAAYEAMRMRRERNELSFSGYDVGESENYNFSTPVYLDFEEKAPDVYDFSAFSDKELSMYLRTSDRRVKDFEKAIAKRGKSMRRLSAEDKTRALLDTVNLNKHIVDHRAMALSAVVAAKANKQKKYRKRLLSDAINEYNSTLSDYEARSGESFPKAKLSLVADIAGGKKYTPLPLISYPDETRLELLEFVSDFDSVTSEYSTKRERNREQLRFLREARREEKRIGKFADTKTLKTLGAGEKLSIFREKIEREIFMLKTRSDALIINAEARLDYLDYSFSASYKDKKKERCELKRRIRELKRNRKRSLKSARRNSERYYSQLLVSAESLGITKRDKRDKLDSLNMQLDALLSERERINEQLIKLYSGDIRGAGDKKINLKIKKIKKNTARRVFRRFRRDMRVLERRVPLDIKEKLAKSVNKIIDAEVLAAVLKYKIKRTKPIGEVKRDMKTKIRENRAAIKYYLGDYRRFLKRARAYAEREKGIKIQIVWILGFVAVLVALALLYLRFEAPVNEFFYRIFKFMR